MHSTHLSWIHLEMYVCIFISIPLFKLAQALSVSIQTFLFISQLHLDLNNNNNIYFEYAKPSRWWGLSYQKVLIYVLPRLLRWMNVFWPQCVGVSYPPGSRRVTPARCSTAPATAAAKTFSRKSPTRCALQWKSSFSVFCRPSVLSLPSWPLFKGPPAEGTALRHHGWWILRVAEGGQGEAAFLHLLSSEKWPEPGAERGPAAGRHVFNSQYSHVRERGNLAWPGRGLHYLLLE